MRQVTQLSGASNNLAALCDDGTIWLYKSETAGWVQLPLIPGQSGTLEAADAVTLHDRVAVERQERAEQARRERFQGKL
jgi:hypothetical protein